MAAEGDALLAGEGSARGWDADGSDARVDVERGGAGERGGVNARARWIVVAVCAVSGLGVVGGTMGGGVGGARAALGFGSGATCSRAHPGYSAPYVGMLESIGEWPERYLRADRRCGGGEATLGSTTPTLGKWPYARPNQDQINKFMRDWSASFAYAYSIPANGKKKSLAMRNNSALAYNFIHVPKAGGTYFNEAMIKAYSVSGEKHGYSYPLKEKPFVDFVTLPLMDATQENVHETTEHFRSKTPKEYFGSERLKELYDKGSRMFIKGQFGMGMCDVIDAPCMYFTVLRDPVSRYLSHYKYSCLSGAEGRSQWTDEWKKLGRCPLDPVEFMDHLGINLDWTVELAPGAHSPDRMAEAAKRNLDSNCMRYLLTEKYDDGLDKLGKAFPDFEVAVRKLKNMPNAKSAENVAKSLPKWQQDRFDAYVKNATMMKLITDRHALMKQVYDHAVDKYESNWARPLTSC